VMSIIGGAVCPLIMGRISDAWNIQGAFAVPLLCHAFVLYFAVIGYRSTRSLPLGSAMAVSPDEV